MNKETAEGHATIGGSSRGGGGGGGGGVTAFTAGLNIDPAASTIVGNTLTVATLSTGFLQETHSNVTAPRRIFQKSRGTKGAPTVVTTADFIGADEYQPYDGVAYINTVRTYAQVTPGATIGAGVVPSDYVINVNTVPIPANPKTTAGYIDSFRVIPNTANQSAMVAVNAPTTFTEAQMVMRGSLTHETSCFNAFGTAVTGPQSFSLLAWRPNSAAAFVDLGGLAWIFADNTANAEATTFEVTGLYAGISEIFMRGTGVVGNAANSRGQMETTYGWSWTQPATPLFRIQAGLGTDFDMILTRRKDAPALTSYKFGQYADGGNFLFINSVNTAGLAVGTNINAGIFCDSATGAVYLGATPGSSVLAGPSGFLANAATTQFFGLPTMHGPPTAQPGFIMTGKTPTVVDDTARGAWLNRTGSNVWDFVPTVAAGVLGAFVGVRTAIFPDGAGGTYTVISST